MREKKYRPKIQCTGKRMKTFASFRFFECSNSEKKHWKQFTDANPQWMNDKWNKENYILSLFRKVESSDTQQARMKFHMTIFPSVPIWWAGLLLLIFFRLAFVCAHFALRHRVIRTNSSQILKVRWHKNAARNNKYLLWPVWFFFPVFVCCVVSIVGAPFLRNIVISKITVSRDVSASIKHDPC